MASPAWAQSTIAPAADATRLPSTLSGPDTLALPVRRDWDFAADGLRFDSRFDGAHLDDVQRLGRRHYRLLINPEVEPINPSPWYAFRVTADAPGALTLELDYTASRHRYAPWRRGDATVGSPWTQVDPARVRVHGDGDAVVELDVPTGTTRVAGQPMVELEDMAAWQATLATRTALDTRVIGQSLDGRPLDLLAFGNPDATRLVVVTGRQHPPETTGARALMKFVDALTADTPDARAFRARHRIVVMPVLNPDGVVRGHWRTNAAGVDINRDWGLFRQPETRALRDALWHEAEGAGREVVFALDFHSTWSDVLYTVEEDPSRAADGVLGRWIAGLETRFPGRIRESPSTASSAVFKNWAFRRFGAPAVTYEVGDDTPDTTLQQVADAAAAGLIATLADGGAHGDGP